MSALETTVRVNSEKQTLILAGEPVPQRFAYGASPSRRPVTLVATPVDDPKLIVQHGFEVPRDFAGFPELTALPRNGGAYNAAVAYARTQQFAVGSSRTAIIDTYA
jgi:hypothetical protein